jgi:glutamyl-Q tRNA(Asp) synthetase
MSSSARIADSRAQHVVTSEGKRSYRGRFAPSPTGPLHFGSLVAAAASYLDARAHGGSWLVRIEDLDPPRVAPGAADAILHALEAYGMQWDGAVLYQSMRTPAYSEAFAALQGAGALYPCGCTRREIALSAQAGADGLVYPGTCRRGLPPGRTARAWRVSTQGARVSFTDCIQGDLEYDMERELGDFVVCRADGLYAYQLAVVVDDAAQGITHVVRGADLIDSTPRQIHLQRLLAMDSPCYAHVPVAVDGAGEKLSKQTRAPALDTLDPAPTLVDALAFLGQESPPQALGRAAVSEIWQWALDHWSLDRVARTRARPCVALPS